MNYSAVLLLTNETFFKMLYEKILHQMLCTPLHWDPPTWWQNIFFETSPFGGLYALLLREIIAHTNPQSHMCSTHLFVGRPVGNILYLVFICRLLLFKQWIRETGKGREELDHIYPWINRVKRGGCLLQEITRQDKGGLFSPSPFLNRFIHAATPPPFYFIQGDSISILVPSLASPINSCLPCVGP